MGKRFLILIGAAALGAALMAAGASADFRSVHDPRGDTKCGHELGQHGPCLDRSKRNADIVRATAGHEGGQLRHTIRVVGKFNRGGLAISTDSDPRCEWFLEIRRGEGRSGEVQECDGDRTSPARYDFHHHSVEIFFSEKSIGSPQSYGWSVHATAGGCSADNCVAIGGVGPSPHAEDGAPTEPNEPIHYIRHRLGQTAAKAFADVHKYDTRLTITRDMRAPHGDVLSDRDRDPVYHPEKAVRKCMEGRRVILFKQRPGADRRLGTTRSDFRPDYGFGIWGFSGGPRESRVYAKVTRKVRDRFVCRADRSAFG